MLDGTHKTTKYDFNLITWNPSDDSTNSPEWCFLSKLKFSAKKGLIQPESELVKRWCGWLFETMNMKRECFCCLECDKFKEMVEEEGVSTQ